MNVYDSARMEDVLAAVGYAPTDTADAADLVILNTCHIREKAAEKVFSELGRLAQVKRARRRLGKEMVLGVAGCVAQAEGAEILRRAPEVDIVVGPRTYHRLPEMVARALREGRGAAGGIMDIEFPAEAKFDHLPETTGRGPAAFLSVQEGCDKFCTFCVVPYTRGAEFSRPAAQVLEEARRLVAGGAREITLLGQNVNAYHGARDRVSGNGGEMGLGELIRRLAEIKGLDRIRYTTSHPADVDDDLIAAHGEVPALMPFLHLPIQSGSDRVLQAMNRRHRVDDYRAIVDRFRHRRPDLALSSDFIVGFPGEDEKDFLATLALADEIGFTQAYSFKYSRRPGTPGAALGGQVRETVKAERLAELQARLQANQTRFNQACVGRVLTVLLDRPGRKPGQFAGRSPYMQPVHVAANGLALGDLVALRIVSGHANSLGGEPASGDALGHGQLERIGA